MRRFRRLSAALAAIISLVGFQSAAAGNDRSCSDRFAGRERKTSPESFQKPSICREMSKDKSGAYKAYPDGTALPNFKLASALEDGPPTRKTAEKLKALTKLQSASPAKILATAQLAEKLRALFIDDLTHGAPPENQNATLKYLVQRLRSLKIKNNNRTGLCNSLLPQASFDLVENSISICASVENYPNESLIPVLAHEFSHAIDPCDFDPLVYSATAEKWTEKESPEKGVCGGVKIEPAVDGRQEAGTKSLAYDSLRAPLAYFCGFVEQRNPALTSADLKNFPYRSTLQCIDQPRGGVKLSVGVRAQAVFSTVQDQIAKLQTSGVSPGPLFHLKAAPEPISKYMICKNRENFADTIGAHLTDLFIAKYGSSLDPVKMHDSLYAFTAMTCDDPKGGAFGPYDFGARRARRFLSYPRIQDAIGCHEPELHSDCSPDEAIDQRSFSRTKSSS